MNCLNHNGYTGDSDQCPTCNPGAYSHDVVNGIADLYEKDGAARIAGHLRACAAAYQVGYHGTQPLSEASGSGTERSAKENDQLSATATAQARKAERLRAAAPSTLSVAQARAALLKDFGLRISMVRCDSSAPVDLCPESIDRLIRAVSASAPASPPWQDIARKALQQIHLECLEDGHNDSGALGDWCPASGRQVTRCGICVALVAVTAALGLPRPTGTEEHP
jgi:hypothetical protein